MKNKKTELSKTEWLIMNICWKKGKSSARDIFEESLKTKTRSYHTVKTMLDRLVVKGYLAREKFGPIWLYSPIVAKSKTTGKEIERFVSTVLDNTFTPLLSFFSEKESLTDEEIQSLEKLIEENKKGKTK
jgi:BlaI family penicillinase repressor